MPAQAAAAPVGPMANFCLRNARSLRSRAAARKPARKRQSSPVDNAGRGARREASPRNLSGRPQTVGRSRRPSKPATSSTKQAGLGHTWPRAHEIALKWDIGRWLGFLHAAHPDDLLRPPADRISLERVRDFVAMLSLDMRPSSVAQMIHSLCYAARLIAGGARLGMAFRHQSPAPRPRAANRPL